MRAANRTGPRLGLTCRYEYSYLINYGRLTNICTFFNRLKKTV